MPIPPTAWPLTCREIPDPPPLLFVHGDPAALSAPQIAIVGTRNPSPPGRETAQSFARFLAGAGLAVTSGMALGIDAAAHRVLAFGGELKNTACLLKDGHAILTQHLYDAAGANTRFRVKGRGP